MAWPQASALLLPGDWSRSIGGRFAKCRRSTSSPIAPSGRSSSSDFSSEFEGNGASSGKPAGRSPFTILRGVLVSINWLIFIWAVNAGHIVETSMGYFITPLLNLVFGTLVFHEKLRTRPWIAVVLAVIGVLVATTEAHHGFPWIAVGIALSFASYGALKKVAQIAPMPGLVLETAVMTPFALLWLAQSPIAPESFFHSRSAAFLIGGGIITAFPLLWFAQAAQSLRLTTISFLQFLAPSLSFFIGVFIYHEPFSTTRWLAFSFIWAGVIAFSLDAWHVSRSAQPSLLPVTME